MKTIPVYSLTDEERKEAIHEWAEGNEYLEELLWNCYKNGIETSGCHYGQRSYFDIRVNDEQNKVKKMLYLARNIPKVQILVQMEGHNPKSGPDWYKPNLGFATFSVAEADQDILFNTLNDALKNGDNISVPEKDAFSTMVDIYDFFLDKGSSLMFRVRKDEEGKFKYYAELTGRKTTVPYCEELFTKAGMTRNLETDSPFPEWSLEAADYEELTEKMTHFRDVVLSEWSLEAPQEITDDLTASEKALIKRREFGDSEEGQRKLIKYFESQLPKAPLSVSIKWKTAYVKRKIHRASMFLADKILGLGKPKSRDKRERRGEEK